MSNVNRPFWGTILFEQIGDGCYNGVWQNNDLTKPGRIHNEIIRKIDGDRNTIDGNYTSSWIEGTNEPIITILEIRRINNTGNNIELSFTWNAYNNPGNILFSGVGMEIGLNKVIAFYWHGNPDTFTIRR